MTTNTVNNMQADNITTWLELEAVKLGTENQRERHMAGFLPDEELTALARTELFKGFDSFRRWAGRDRAQLMFTLKHKTAKALLKPCKVSKDSIELDTTDAVGLNADEWNTLKRIQSTVEAMKDHPWICRAGCDVSVVSSTHLATCTICNSTLAASSVKITIHWAGHDLTREYAL